MIIIIEGTDRVGKTTQTNLLLEKFKDRGPFHKVHYSALPFKDKKTHISYSKSMYADMFNMMKGLNVQGHNIIFDRSHLGESVYAPLYRGYSGDFVFDIENEYLSKDLAENIYLVTLVNDPSIILSRDDGKSFYKDEDGVKNEVNGFMRAHKMSSIKNKILITVGDETAEGVSKIITDFINEKEKIKCEHI